MVAGGQFSPRMPPLRFLVDGRLGHGAQRTDCAAISTCHSRGNLRTGRFVHEWHELVREARHGAADADAADVGTTADSGHPAPLGHVAVDNGDPAAKFDDALGCWGPVVNCNVPKRGW